MTALPNLAVARPFPIVIVGHIDHGKSTLIGRLLNDTGTIPKERVEAVQAASKARGRDMEWAYLLDGFQAERDRGITIDSARIRFASQKRTYTIIDAPGHREFLKNMITGAASAEAAVLVIDVHEGLAQQTKRHAHLLNLLGVRRLIVAVNKMDLVGGDQAAFDGIETEIRAYLADLGVTPEIVLPMAARQGHNVVTTSDLTPWYEGPTLVEILDALPPQALVEHLPLRLPVQDVYDFTGPKPAIVGRVESGHLRPGDRLLFQPSGQTATVAVLEGWNGKAGDHATAGRSVAITLDTDFAVARGDVAMSPDTAVAPSDAVDAAVFWFAATPLSAGREYTLKTHTARYQVTVAGVDNVIDSDSLIASAAGEIGEAGIGHVVLKCDTPMVLEAFTANRNLGRFVLLDGYETVGGGIVLAAAAGTPAVAAQPVAHRADVADPAPVEEERVAANANIFRVAGHVPPAARATVFGHKGGILWFAGLSGSGKSTIAYQLEQRLIERGQHAFVLDGDNLRHGVSAGLGFSPEDRAEHNRRAGEVAALFADAGVIAIVALISPYRADRAAVRAMRPYAFHEIFIDAPLEVCQERDPKGLYAKAAAGEIPEFTGVSAPFERPEAPDLTLETGSATVEQSVGALLDYVDRQLTDASNAA